jgi:hypothetical protein
VRRRPAPHDSGDGLHPVLDLELLLLEGRLLELLLVAQDRLLVQDVKAALVLVVLPVQLPVPSRSLG